MSIQIVLAKRKHANAIRRCLKYLEEVANDNCNTQFNRVEYLISHKKIYIATNPKQNRVYGILTFEWFRDNEIAELYVRPHYQRQGIGKSFIKIAIQDYKQKLKKNKTRKDALRVSTISEFNATKFYRKCGFKLKEKRTCLGSTQYDFEMKID